MQQNTMQHKIKKKKVEVQVKKVKVQIKKAKKTSNTKKVKKWGGKAVKKFIINLLLILTFIITYILHANLFTWFRIAGVMPNLFVILVLFIGLYSHRFMGAIYGIIFGLLLDFFISTKIGITAILLAIVGIIGTLFDKNFSKDNRITIIIMVILSTIVFEAGRCLTLYFITKNNVDIWPFIQILLIECIYNAILTVILYPLIQKFGNKIEAEYKGNTVLTRYF